MCKILSEVNHFAAEKGKISICGVFIKAAMILLFVYAGFHLIYLQMIFYSSSIQFFFVSVQVQDANLMLFSKVKMQKKCSLSPLWEI